jgi:hypothetical protein
MFGSRYVIRMTSATDQPDKEQRMTPMIEVTGVVKRFGKTVALARKHPRNR